MGIIGAEMDQLDEEFAHDAKDIGDELAKTRRLAAYSSREVEKLSAGISGELRRSLNQAMRDGVTLSEILRGLGRSISETTFRAATKPVINAASDAIAQGVDGLVSAVIPFAKGGVVSGPVRFPMQGGTGLMGEVGPEAIMPLTRGPDGRLGVASNGVARPVNVTFNINTPDAAGFRRSQSQIAAQMGRLLASGGRNN